MRVVDPFQLFFAVPCFASNILNNFSFLWFACKHVTVLVSHCDIHAPLMFLVDDLCVATSMMHNCSFRWLLCNHNGILSMSCHETFGCCLLGVATKLMNTCSSLCFVCTHDGDDKSLSHLVWFTNLSFRRFQCNEHHMVQNEIAFLAFSNFLGDFVFPNFEDVWTSCLHIDLAFVFHSIYLCCANGVMNKFGHVINDVLLYHAHTYFAWSLVRIGINSGMVTSTSTSRLLSPSLDEDVLASWTTLFEGGGDDVAQPTSITRTNHPTHAKSPWASKVNSFLFEIAFPTLWNGIQMQGQCANNSTKNPQKVGTQNLQ